MPKYAIAVLVAVVMGAAMLAWVALENRQTLQMAAPETLLVKKGDHLSGLGSELQQRGWLPWSKLYFDLYVRLTAHHGHIKVGEYRIGPNQTVPQLIAQMRAGEVIQRSITFPEGWTVAQWAEHLSGNELLTDNNLSLLSKHLEPHRDWEGQLYPDTYSFTRGDSGLEILQRAKARMTRVLDEVWAQRSEQSAVTSPREALILASMIEKETGYEGDRRLIASVFSNRLRLGMKLQSDPTVIYGLDDSYDGDLKRRHLRISHPYNTYVIDALPIAPICNPGRSSLLAAVNPEYSSYLYFVAKGDGRSQFSETLQQHNAAVVQYQKSGRVENYQSAPPSQSGDG
jgi:UPF0755 protein